MSCNNCGGVFEEDGTIWNGKTGYPCECLRCQDCGEVYGSKIESYEWNEHQLSIHISQHKNAQTAKGNP